jgi:hypothetical protein
MVAVVADISIVTQQVITTQDTAAIVILAGLLQVYTILVDRRTTVHLVLVALVQIGITTVPTSMTEDSMVKVVFA